MPLTSIEPQSLWRSFDLVRKVPRPSKHESKIRDALLEWAGSHGFKTRQDAIGNIVIVVPASPGHESAPVLVIQSHMDMVCEKNDDVAFDFMTDSIQVERDGDWITARGTTLGADNGIGLAAGMGIAIDSDAVHGPMELLVTVDEETGLTGAAELDPSIVTGRLMLNLDSEEPGSVYIGCAGGADSELRLAALREPPHAETTGLKLTVSGLRGGHSGSDIHEERGNAIRCLARVLRTALDDHPVRIDSLSGGSARNAIPREASAVLSVPRDAVDDVRDLAERTRDELQVELGDVDPGLRIAVEAATLPTSVVDEATMRTIVDLLLALPHGVEGMSRDVPGLVETSCNLASIHSDEDGFTIVTSSRSSIMSALLAMRSRVRATAELAGARVTENNAYPGWKPNLKSELLAVAKGVHEKLYNRPPEIKAIHAGLECGILGDRCPGMDMISIGPIITGAHSPDERVSIPSVQQFWEFLTAVVAEVARIRPTG